MTALARSIGGHTDAFRHDFARREVELPGGALQWLQDRRRAAMTAFTAIGVPNRRVEAWKYTDLANLLEPDLLPITGSGDADERVSPLLDESNHLRLFNGFLSRCASDDAIDIVDLSALRGEVPDWLRENFGVLACGPDQPMGAASLALMRGGVAIRVRRDNSLALHFSNGASLRPCVSHCRVLLLVESGVSVRLLESHTGETSSGSLRNIGVELILNANSRLEHIRLQKDAADAVHVTSLGAMLRRDSQYRACYAALGARASRLDINIRLTGDRSEAALHHVAAVDTGIADITSVIDHASPNTRSRQLFKNVAGGHGRVVNQGRVIVREGSVKSDSHQLFKALLLSPRAEVDAKPELEIFADDVLCGHGTAIGALDEDALFYLRSRGIPEEEAKRLLIRAFLAEAVEGFGNEAIRDSLWQELEGALTKAAKASR